MAARRLTLQEARNTNRTCCFDACVLIDAFNGMSDFIEPIRRGNRMTSAIALWEFLHGTAGQLLSQEKRAQRRRFLTSRDIKVPRFRGADSLPTRIGLPGPSSVQDALIAADCLSGNMALVTANVGDFESVDGLILVGV